MTKNIDTSQIRKKIKENYKMEVSRPLDAQDMTYPVADRNIRLKFCTKVVRKISLNGHLLPLTLVNKDIVRLNKYETPFINRVFLRKKIIVVNEINSTCFMLERQPGYFLRNLFMMFKTSVKFCLKYDTLKSQYRMFMQNMKNDKFWKETFQK